MNKDAERQAQKNVRSLGATDTPAVVCIIRAVVRIGRISSSRWNRYSHWIQSRRQEVRKLYVSAHDRKHLRSKAPGAEGHHLSTSCVAEVWKFEDLVAASITALLGKIRPSEFRPMSNWSGILVRFQPKARFGGLLLKDEEEAFPRLQRSTASIVQAEVEP